MRRLRPFGMVRSIAELPKSKSGPVTSGQLSRPAGQLTRYASFGVNCFDHSRRPVRRSNAMTASDVSAAGWVYASPVATYTAFRFTSTVGEDQIAAPAGPHCWTPIEFFFVGFGGSAMVYAVQSG